MCKGGTPNRLRLSRDWDSRRVLSWRFRRYSAKKSLFRPCHWQAPNCDNPPGSSPRRNPPTSEDFYLAETMDLVLSKTCPPLKLPRLQESCRYHAGRATLWARLHRLAQPKRHVRSGLRRG